MTFATWLEQLGISVWLRESGSVWAYPTVLFLHTLGLSLAVGLSLVVSARVLGLAKDLPLAPFAKFAGLLWTGFWINFFSGLLLLAAGAASKLANPVFYIKMALIALAVGLTKAMWRGLASSGGNRGLAAGSLFCWFGAIAAGRLLAYLGTHTPGR